MFFFFNSTLKRRILVLHLQKHKKQLCFTQSRGDKGLRVGSENFEPG